MPVPRKHVSLAAGLGLVASALLIAPSPAQAASSGLVISEVYGAGGNSGAVLDADYVELYNPTSSDIPLTDLGLQYRSATGSGGATTALSGTVAAGDHFVVRVSAPGTNGAPLPVTDLVAPTNLNLSGSAGQVMLLPSTTPFAGSGNVANDPALVDMIGFGTSATTFEGAPTGVNLTAATSAQRYDNRVDTDNNADDFSEGGPTPGEGIVAPDDRTIAEIQGTGDASPLNGDYVRTTGVMTSRYATGGFEGFHIQTGGTPETPGASDGVFVYAPGVDPRDLPPIGTSVAVIGDVTEFNGLTEVTADSVSVISDLPGVMALTVPWSDLDTNAEREGHESELVAPQGPFTVTDSYNVDNFGEIGLAAGTKPLVNPTDVEDFQTGNVAGVAADNAARAITLDDGATINFREGDNTDTPYPWLTPSTPVRVGAPVTFTDHLVLDYRFGEWKLEPQRRVTGSGAAVATFKNTRTNAPGAVGGDLRLATFNVLNFFPTTGVEFDLMPGTTCTFFRDRDGERTTVNRCDPNGPRGAADDANLARQRSKIVEAINALGASVVSLEELENSAKFGKDRDFAIGKLVDALNADAGAGTWAFVPSPDAADRPTPAQEDVIRNGFIYKPADVELVGASKILMDEVNFDNAREPLAQVFKPVGTSDESAFAVIVNHFKSKGSSGASGANVDSGQGAYTADRIGQATALDTFADSFAAERGVEAVFLAGDFNSYSKEDPMQVLYDAGYTKLESTVDPGEASYSFDGMSGSLDHVVANAAAKSLVTGVDIWNINAEEAVAYEYSRYNSNVTQLFDGSTPFKASDHNPEVVGLDLAGIGPEEIQIIGTNDFHGRLAAAPKLAGAVKQFRAENPQTVFAAAGDLIGATTFESFIQHDKPTIDVMNEAGLEVSSVGNHEFDQGYDDLVNRVMAPYDAETNPEGGAEWKYLGANVKHDDGTDALEATWIRDFGDVEVGFIGAVTEDLPSLVSASGLEGITVTDVVEETNAAATDLKAEGADVVVLLVHEGASSVQLESATNPNSPFGHIVNNVSADVDAIISGHTHLAYNHSIPVPEWQNDPGRIVKERPVVSAGQYGERLNKLSFTVDSATGQVITKAQSLVTLPGTFPVDTATQAIVNAANAAAGPLGARVLGEIEAPFYKAKFGNGTTDNRGGESTLGNLVAEVQRWATESPEAGEAQIAFMNPGGLRQDMVGVLSGEDRNVTFKQAADVQPFANTLINMDMTGETIRKVLEQQWQNNADGSVPARPFLKLGVSEGFEYTYDPTLPEDSRITGMWLNGEAIDPQGVYSVTANSFLASGTGDNFFAFSEATNKRDTGKIDLQAMVDYMDEFANTGEGDAPLPVDYAQRAVGVAFPATAPEAYAPGDTVEFALSSLSMSAPTDVRDQTVTVSLGDQLLGTFDVTSEFLPASDANSNDEAGKASVSITLPEGVEPGTAVLLVEGATTGTSTQVPVTVAQTAKLVPTIESDHSPNRVIRDETRALLTVKVFSGDLIGTGTVTFKRAGEVLKVKPLTDSGEASILLPKFGTVGEKRIRIIYSGDDLLEAAEKFHTVNVVRG